MRLFKTISVVIPTLNEEKYISPLLHLLQNTLEEGQIKEAIVVDGGSTDGTVALLQSFPGINLIQTTPGRGHQLSTGARKATGEILMFFHADVIPPRNFPSLIMYKMNYDIEFGQFCYKFDRSGHFLNIFKRKTKREGIFSGGGDQGLFVSRKLYEQVRGYDPSLDLMEDFDLYWKLKSTGAQSVIIQTPLIVSSRKYTKNNWLMIQLVNSVIFFGFKLGASSKQLTKLYNYFFK